MEVSALSSKKWTVIIAGLLAIQVFYGCYSVFMGAAMEQGLDPFFLVSTINLVIFFFLFPFAVAIEWRKWPKELSFGLLVKILVMAVGGVTIFQTLLSMGVKKTSPTVSSSMINLAPGLIFIISCSLRLEKVNIKCTHGKAKVFGTLMCLMGVMAMSLLKDPQESPTRLTSSYGHVFLSSASLSNTDADWIIGCLCVVAAVFILSCCTVLQAATLIEFPAPLSLSAILSLIGGLLTAVVQLINEGKVDIGNSPLNVITIAIYVIVVGVMLGVCIGFHTWCIEKCGPVLASMFSPIGTVSAAVLSAFVLGKVLSFGSMVGIIVMFGGLYVFLWAKNKECYDLDDGGGGDDGNKNHYAKLVDDVEQPLLT